MNFYQFYNIISGQSACCCHGNHWFAAGFYWSLPSGKQDNITLTSGFVQNYSYKNTWKIIWTPSFSDICQKWVSYSFQRCFIRNIKFSFRKMYLTMLSLKCWPFYSGVNVLTQCGPVMPCSDNDLGQHRLRLRLVAWRHQAITQTNVDLSSRVFYGVHTRAISPGMLMNLIKVNTFKITPPSPRGQWVNKSLRHCSMLPLLLKDGLLLPYIASTVLFCGVAYMVLPDNTRGNTESSLSDRALKLVVSELIQSDSYINKCCPVYHDIFAYSGEIFFTQKSGWPDKDNLILLVFCYNWYDHIIVIIILTCIHIYIHQIWIGAKKNH